MSGCLELNDMNELEKACRGCGHQRAVHTGGAKPGGWAIYDPVWANASGWCRQLGCSCKVRS